MNIDNNVKLLKTFNSRIEAELAKSFLESSGIKSMILADDAGEMYPAASVYWGVKLFVNEKDFEIADKLINESYKDIISQDN
ncbi:MAG: DUF2007 domain-containing protein [Actinobacteria bacterium]|nr:DUF2007 domain-containing protein [Cyanobacteriota bacterium]MCL5770868.1 DUF2007 domain-containing protein [Actinomycetota bacterium]